MQISYIPTCLLDEEAPQELRDMGIKLEEGKLVVGGCKVNCIRVYNMTETQVFDRLETKALLETKASDAELKTYASRNLAIIFTKLRQVQNIKDKDMRCAATCSLLAAVNSLAVIDSRTAQRFLPIIRGIQ